MSDQPETINWTEPMLQRLKATYAKESKVKGPNDTFMFDQHEFVISYAKYLIQYLETIFPPRPENN